MGKSAILKKIHKAAINYQQYLAGKTFMYVYEGKSIEAEDYTYFDYIDEKYQFNKMPNKYNEYTSNHIIDYSASWMGTTRLFAYLGEWLVSNYIVTKFNQNSIKYLHKHDYLTN